MLQSTYAPGSTNLPNLDNITHTLLATAIAKTRIGRRSPLSALALVVGANLPPDVAAEYHINRDYIFGTLLAIITMPLIRGIIR